MADKSVWSTYAPPLSPISGARRRIVAIPSDTVDITDPDTFKEDGVTHPTVLCRAVLCLSAGNIAVLLADDLDDGGHAVTVPFATGEIKPLICRRVMNTNTTVAAANIILLM